MLKIRRDSVVFALIFLGFVAIGVRAFYVQVVKTEFLQAEGDKRQIRTIAIPAPRGEIYDRNGELLALSTPMASVWVDAKVIIAHETNYHKFLDLLGLTDSQLNALAKQNRYKKLSFIRQLSDKKLVEKIAELELPGTYTKYVGLSYDNGSHHIEVNKLLPSIWVDMRVINRYRYTPSRLAAVLGTDRLSILNKIYKYPKRRFLYLKRGVIPDVAEKIDDMRLTGVYTQGEYRRYFPSGESSANLIGFTNIDDQGQEGIELAYNDWLRGEPGKKQVVKDRAGHVVDFVKDVKAAKPGNPMTLSIDQNLQYVAYKALKKVMIEHQARGASSVILDAKTGEILSMVSLPGFNPNDPSQRRGQGVKNRVVADLLEPGSTIKPFIVAKALDDGLIDLETKIDTSPGWIRIQGNRISDTHNHKTITPLEVIKKSSNVGTSKIALKMKAEKQRDFWASIGIGQESGLFLPGEALGYLKPAHEWTDTDQASASFGYGFSTNLLDLAHSYLLFSNQGEMLPLSLIKLSEPPKGKALIKPEVANEVLRMMETVVAKGGTAPKAQIPGYRVAGKTGTVHKTKSRGGYKENTYYALFAGIVPVSNPDMIMAVVVDEPSRGVYYGGAVAAPAFKEVMEEALRIRNIAPDQIEPEKH
ncbi:peptidoglycan D,D-transpeptidase FtsI family protein [Thiomicrorhabdus lithotrophica]|uniref:Peptidoglycan D,D-transpeptidase FtsI n=1 Tax=Thiomicrorhabdus lithotrophica TaxID=2949997 RepID=A0ABY8C939_9GAMM|nr:penicillin-binding protein 2 [Thiomicrorhabdus lithotrophica]WEJ62052.1 penicillin-binding protein 2 [Thiomicrorhabdus lithotrophica]